MQRHHLTLLLQLTKRDIAARYRGSVLGIVWSLITPLLLLSVYTFVFTVVFKARWGDSLGQHDDTYVFAFNLFVGLIFHGFLADLLVRSPSLMVENKNYVTKVIFPLSILPAVATLSALFQACINVMILLTALILFNFPIPLHGVLLIPLLAIFTLFGLGIAYGLSAIGTYLRDLQHIMGLIATLLLFLSPVFYPISALPPEWQSIVYLNPLTPTIEFARECLFSTTATGLGPLMTLSVITLGTCLIGYSGFSLLRRGFADIL